MGTSTFAALAGMGMLAMLIMIVGGILLAGLLLCVAFRMVVGYMPSYLRSVGAIVLTFVAVVAVSIVLRMILPGSASGLLTMVVQFLVGAAVVNYLLLAQNGSRIGYGKACLVQLVYLVMQILLGLIIGVVIAMVFGAALFGMH